MSAASDEGRSLAELWRQVYDAALAGDAVRVLEQIRAIERLAITGGDGAGPPRLSAEELSAALAFQKAALLALSRARETIGVELAGHERRRRLRSAYRSVPRAGSGRIEASA
ncbi:MAG: hypothetical protein K6T27_02610 [Thermoleophilum sp.]|nr:hypothetical protein [Thermoleophilum sp.]